MYTDSTLRVINDWEPVLNLNQTNYPASFPKGSIAGLFPVVTVTPPTDTSKVVTGFTIVKSTLNSVDTYTQTWATRNKTQDELDADLVDAKTAKTSSLYTSYLTARSEDISFTTAGASTKNFQADEESVHAIQGMLDTYLIATPVGFYWKASDNTKVTPFLRSDLVGLANVIGVRAWGYFQNLTDKKDAVTACTTVAQVNAITW